MNINEEIEIIKKNLAELIIKHLRENKIAPEKAKQLANDFLHILPIQDQKDLLSKLEKLSENYQETKGIYIEELSKIEEEKSQQTLTQMRNHIQNGNIHQAVETAKAMTKGNL